MKRGKKLSSLTFVVGAILVLLLCATLYITFSYFTSSAKRRGSVTMGALSLELVNSSGATLSTNIITTSITDPIVPGDTITLDNIYVKNTSNFAVYSIIKLRAEITKSGETEPSATYEKWMNLSGNEVVSGTTSADEIASNTQKQGSISLQIPSSLDNTYQGATARLTYKALAVQKAHIPPLENGTEAQYACKYLYEEYMPRDISIKVGNSTAKTMTLDGNTVADVSVNGVTTDNSCGWYYDEACTRPAYSTDVLTSDTELYTKTATTDKISGTSSVSAASTSISGEVVIPQTVNGTKVTTIASNAFKDCTEITSVVIPEGVTKINSSAFSGCSSLETVTIPSTCTSIGTLAFKNNTNLRSVSINNELIDLSAGSTWGDINTVPFYGATTVVFNQYDNAFYLGNENNEYMVLVKIKNKNLTQCTIHSNCKNISSLALSDSKLTSINIPNGLLRIGVSAFQGVKIKDISLPNTLQYIGEAAFRLTNLESLYIPSSVKSIGYGICVQVSTLNTITVDPANKIYDSRNNCNAIIQTSAGTLLQGANYTVIPEGVKRIQTYAFWGKNKFDTTKLPSTLKSIGYYAFQECSITSIIMPSSITDISGLIFRNCNKIQSIFCCATSKPSGWSSDWNGSSATVYWYRGNDPSGESGNFWHYDTDGETPVIWT